MRSTFRRQIFPLVWCALLIGPTGGLRAQTGETHDSSNGCSLSIEDERWMQAALDNWELATDDVLRLSQEPLPWIIYFDKSCVWHLAPEENNIPDTEAHDSLLHYRGEPVPMRSEDHHGEIRLPNGKDIPVGVTSSTMLYNNDSTPFFVVAMPSIWAEIPGLAEAMDPTGFVLGIIAHELVHTRHLDNIARIIERDIRKRYDLPEDIDDNIVDTHFENVPGFAQATVSERALFYRAVEADSDSLREKLVRQALDLVNQRRNRYFKGEDAVYGELEDLFLAMEGVAVWTHYQLSKRDSKVLFRRSENPERMQDEGFVLFLLIDKMVPDWQELIFKPLPASPFQMLQEAVK